MVGLDQIRQIRFGHFPAKDPKVGAMKGDLDPFHVADAGLAHGRVLHRHQAAVHQNGAGRGALSWSGKL